MIQQSFLPSLPLQSIVYRYDFFSFGKNHSSEAEYCYTPSFDSGLLFVFYNGQPVFLKSKFFEKETIPVLTITPTINVPTYNLGFKDVSAIRINFKPGAISKLYNISLKAFQNVIVESDYAVDKNLLFLYERLVNMSSPQEQVLLIEKYLITQLNRIVSLENKLFIGLNKYLIEKGYTTSVKQLAKKLGYSDRNFNRLINRELGISATEFIRIHRFNMVLKYLQQSPRISLTQIAHQIDYYDQSHFIRDFKRMTDQTPRAYLQSIGRQKIMPSNSVEDFI